MSAWRQQAAELLYEGESVRDSVAVDTGGVVVTTHRVLAFTPESSGANFRQVDRPNIEGVATGARSKASLLERGIRYGVMGGLLVVAGQFIDFGAIMGGVDLGGESAGQLGLGGVLGPLQGMLQLLTRLDELMQMGGALAVLLAVVLLGVYWYTREPTLVLEVAGDEDIELPRPSDTEATIARLEDVLAADRGGPEGGGPREPREPPRDPRRGES